MNEETRETVDLETLPLEEKSLGVEVRLSEGQEEELSGYIRAAYGEIKADRTALESEWADNQNRYEATFAKATGPWPGSSDIRPPLSRVVCDTLQAIYMNSMFGNRSKVRAYPIGADDAPKAAKNEKYMKYVLDQEVGMYDLADKFTTDFLGPTGNAFLEPRYVVEQEDREEQITETIQTNPDDTQSPKQTIQRMDTYTETIFDGDKVDIISSEHIYAGPAWENALEAAERDILIKVMPQSLEEIRRKAKGVNPKYHNVDKLEMLPSYQNPSLLQLAKQKVDNITKEYLKGRQVIRNSEVYLWWKIKGEKEERIIVTMDIESGVIFRVIKGRCRIVHLKAYPVRGRFWGRSPLSIIKPLQKHLDAVVNQRVDAGTIANLPHGFYRAGGTFNPQVFSIMPAHMYPVENPGDVAWAPTPKVDSSLYNEEAKVWEYIERLFGLNENQQGVANRQATTATEAIEISKRSSVKFGSPFQRIIHQLNPLLKHLHDLNYEFAPAEKTFRILGRDGVPVFAKYTREDSKARLNYAFEVETIFDEQLARDTMLLAYRLWSVKPQIMMNPAYDYRLCRDAMEAVIGDSTAYLPVPTEAKLPSAEEAIQLILAGERLEPKPGIDTENYQRVFAAFIDDEEFKTFRNDQQQALFDFFAKVKLMQEVFDKFNLNQSGKFEWAMNEMMPPVSSNRNPSQKFNQIKVGEKGASAMENNKNGMRGALASV